MLIVLCQEKGSDDISFGFLKEDNDDLPGNA